LSDERVDGRAERQRSETRARPQSVREVRRSASGPTAPDSRPTGWAGLELAGRASGNARPPVTEGPTPAQNLMLPIMLAMFVVRSLIVGAIVDEAR
jgi:hypothetical protein